MWVVSETYRQAVQGPHQIVVQADVTKGGRRLYTGLPVTGGTIMVDAGSITRRRCDLTIAPVLRRGSQDGEAAFPVERMGAPLGTDGQEISIRHGVRYQNGQVEWVPVGVFRIDSVDGSLLGQSGVRVAGVSREAWVADARFMAPRTIKGPSATALITTLITEVLGSATVAALTRTDRRVSATVLEEDRWEAIATLADSIGCVVYADPTGRFVIADAPTMDSPPAWRFQTGPGGIALDITGTRSREYVYNAVVVTGATPDGATTPVRGMATDSSPSSPTRYGDPATGAWGIRPYFMAIPSLTRPDQCAAVARTQLARVTGAGTTLDISSVPLAPLEALDVVDVVTDHTRPAQSVTRHIIDSMTLPLLPGEPFTLSTRDLGRVD